MTLMVLVLAGCAAFGPATPAKVAPTLDDLRHLGLSCSSPGEDDVPSGLLGWTCRGNLPTATLNVVLDGDGKGVFDVIAQVPTGTDRAAVIAAFTALVGAIDAIAGVSDEVRSWVDAWDGSAMSAEFGITKAMLQPDAAWVTLSIWPGPRNIASDPMP